MGGRQRIQRSLINHIYSQKEHLMTEDIQEKIKSLKTRARKMRKSILTMLARAGSGHTGGSLSTVEMLLSLYFYKMRHRPEYPAWEDRDRFVLSKGHGAPALYAVLASCGYFSSEELGNLRQIDSMLHGHPFSLSTPGVEISTGSLGQGLSIANGMAMAARLSGKTNRIYVMMGDGETQEGQVWEAAMTAAHYRLDNVCALLDNNELQIDGRVADIMGIEPIGDKWRAFGWHVIEIDGHDFAQITQALDEAETVRGKPTIIWAHTVKGKGVSFMEHQVKYHGAAPTPDELDAALKEIDLAGV
jgi:transketolase